MEIEGVTGVPYNFWYRVVSMPIFLGSAESVVVCHYDLLNWGNPPVCYGA